MVTVVTILAALAAWSDLRKSIIPNRLLFSGMGVGILLRAATGILRGDIMDLFAMAAEVIVLFICLWPVYVTGGLGAGDCKLLLLAGVFLPAKQAVFVIVSSFLIAAVGIILRGLIRSAKSERRKIHTIHFAPAFFIAVLIGWL